MCVSEICISETCISEIVISIIQIYKKTGDPRSHECNNTEVMKTASPESKDIIDVFRARYVQEGIEQGIEQGLEKGIEQGIEQGLVKTARNMIEKGYSDQQISEITNLTVKRIQSLRDS